ncbi:mandelate racemase/muconate lactonizing enzyme family protein [Stratiformator vulcanicus]|uniref:Isomerase YitF n=1 Tax=Stratiformator vulcanicus TaxID=2527980 RepID=A0A517QXE1_9PLAN|nr:mandelate racemase/muconate lactonizing enzyme family protein [Stratiformator vulcanicus]QDT36322.1 Putative isomerase YitF [Stratiformator vulcanicus]
MESIIATLFGERPRSLNRRRFLAGSAAGLFTAYWTVADGGDHAEGGLKLRKNLAVKSLAIAAIELLQDRNRYWCRVSGPETAFGVAEVPNRVMKSRSLLNDAVAPYFLGRDGWSLETLVDGVYVANSNYKLGGVPFWICVAAVELATLDMLGRQVGKPVGELFADRRRNEVPIYISRFNRDNAAAGEVASVADVLKRTGATACKLKVGRRMSNTKAQARRDLKMVELARSEFGDDVAIYLDANGSYTTEGAIRLGREFAKSGVGFLEEPCPWEDFESTRQVAEALELPIAGGEQDSSLPKLRWMMRHGALDLVQPDLFYHGGMIRCLRLAKIAGKFGLKVTPHSPKVGGQANPMLQFASIVPNIGPHQEYRETGRINDGKVTISDTPGLGIKSSDLKNAKSVLRVVGQ